MSLMSTTLRALVNRSLAPFGSPKTGQRFPNSKDLVAATERKTRLSDWGEPHFLGGLNALLEALEELPGLNPLGVATFGNMIRQALGNRLLFVGDSTPPSELNLPVVITGLPRSGTTALHRLLALDPVFHAPPLWELLDPFSTPSPDLRRWRTKAQISFKNRLLPDLDQKHFTRADTPEECTLLLANSFASPLFWDLAPLEGYLEWVQTADQRPVYEDYRRQLQILQARHPNRRLLLKAPAHLGNLAILHEVVPEAHLIQIHRDPTKCFFSHCSLRETLTSFVTDRPDREAIASQVRRVFEHDLRSNVEFHNQSQGVVIDVACGTLRRTPLDLLEELHGRLDLGWGSSDAGRAKTSLERPAGGGPGRHHYSDLGWGVTRDRVEGLFGGYREGFGWAFEG
jgi:Sulfotransferase family